MVIIFDSPSWQTWRRDHKRFFFILALVLSVISGIMIVSVVICSAVDKPVNTSNEYY
jgi:hypothetical protein